MWLKKTESTAPEAFAGAQSLNANYEIFDLNRRCKENIHLVY